MSEEFIKVIRDGLFANTNQSELSAERIYEVAENIADSVFNALKKEFISKPFNVEVDSSRSDGRVILSGNFFEFNTGDKARIVFVKSDI